MTNVKQSSIDAYHQEKPKMPSQKIRIASFMAMNESPLTRAEIGQEFGFLPNVYSPRCNELVSAGVLLEVGERVCSITGKKVGVLQHKIHAAPQKSLFN